MPAMTKQKLKFDPEKANHILIVQPALPRYRLPLFTKLSESPGLVVTLIYSVPEALGVLNVNADLVKNDWLAVGKIKWVFGLFGWQPKVSSIDLRPYDAIVVCGEPRVLSNLIIMLRARISRTPVIWWGHYWTASSKPFRARIRMILARYASSILFYTDLEVEEYLRIHPNAKLVEGLNNGVSNTEIKEFRVSYRAHERQHRLLFIGRITKKAELDLLIRSLSMSGMEVIKLDIIGDGERTYVQSLKNLSEDLGVNNRINWLGSLVDEVQIAAHANRARLFVYPGSVGLSLIHAYSYGIPSVVHANRWKQMPEIAAFYESKAGVVFEAGSVQSLATSIVDLIEDESELDEKSRRAVKMTDTKFNTIDMSKRFHSHIRKVLRLDVP
jgi:glycosyltransferase involved in cell wall biosynthesis